MEAFALLRYWCTTAGTGGAAAATTTTTGDSVFKSRRITKPAAAASYSGYGFDGPYFDLEFTLDREPADETSDSTETESDSEIENGEMRFSFASDESEDPIVKSDTGFQVLILNLKSDSNAVNEKDEKLGEKIGVNDERENQGKMLRVKFDLKELNYCEGFKHDLQNSETNSISERNLGKELSQKYLNMLKTFYIRVEKMKLSGAGSPGYTAAEKGCSAAKWRSSVKSGNNLLNVMCKHLGKRHPTLPPPPPKRREEVVVEDGIQGAILHCKRSFSSDRGN